MFQRNLANASSRRKEIEIEGIGGESTNYIVNFGFSNAFTRPFLNFDSSPLPNNGFFDIEIQYASIAVVDQ